MSTLLAVTMGDPCGCGPLITAEAWRHFRGQTDFVFFVIGAPEAYMHDVAVIPIDTPEDARTAFKTGLPILPIQNAISSPLRPGHPDPDNAAAIIESIARATDLALQNKISGLITNPISKENLYKAGFKHPGHTEFIADLCSSFLNKPVRPVMMLAGGGLKVALATIHIPLTEVALVLNRDDLVEIATLTHQALQNDFGLARPRLAFTGLNPHAGENGTIGREELEIINPAAVVLRAHGINISNARPGDTVFHEMLSGDFDAIIAMTHDQGLIPVKTLDFWGGVNITLGLPIIRTSPDHGTAYDAAASGQARADSLIAAINQALEMSTHRHSDHV